MVKKVMFLVLLTFSFHACMHTKPNNQVSPSINNVFSKVLQSSGHENNTTTISQLKKIIKQHKSFYPAYQSLVEACTTQSTLQEADSYFKMIDDGTNPYILWALGLVNEKMGAYDIATVFYKRSIEMNCTFHGAYEGIADICLINEKKNKNVTVETEKYLKEIITLKSGNKGPYFGLSYLYYKQGRFKEAITEAGKALEESSLAVHTNFLLGQIYSEIYEAEKALGYYGKSLPGYKNLGDKNKVVLVLNNMGMIYHAISNHEKALESYEESLALARDINNKYYEGGALGNIGEVYLELSQYSKALDYHEQSLAIALKIGNDNSAGSAYNNIGQIHDRLSNYQKAIEYYEKSLNIFQKNEDKMSEAAAFNNIGGIYQELSDYPKSIEYREKALDITREIGFKYGEGVSLCNIGLVYSYLSNYLKAIEYGDKSLSIFKEIGNKYAESAALGNIGGAYHELSQYSKALDYHKQSLEIARELGDKHGEKSALRSIGIAYLEMSDYSKALDFYEKGLVIAKELGDISDEGTIYYNMCEVYGELSEYPEAFEYGDKALRIFEKIGDKQSESIACTKIGNVHMALKDYNNAFSVYNKAIGLVESIRNGFKSEDYKTGFFQKYSKLYDNMITCLFELHQKNPKSGFDHLSFTYGQKSKARGLLDLLTESNADIRLGVDKVLKEQELELEREYAEINTALQNLLSGPATQNDETKLNRLEADLKAITGKMDQLKKQIIRQNPEYAELKYPEPVTINQLQTHLLKKNSLLIEYKITENGLFVWGISYNKFYFTRLSIGEEELSEKVLALRNCIRVLDDEDITAKRAAELLNILLRPLLNFFDKKDELLIIPDGILNYLPFETLISEEGDYTSSFENLSFLLNNYSIHYAPSATVAFNLSKRTSVIKKENNFFAMGDPVFSEQEFNAENGYLRSTLSDEDRSKLKRLIYSGEEVKNISSLFNNATVYLREDATEEHLKSGDLEDFKYIHLATHGLFNEKNPLFSGLIFTLDDDPLEDGFLMTREIFNIKINADLVVLSACSTGLGKRIAGEGIVGLTRAWFYAGASSLIVSLWNINDQSTSQLMGNFYRKIQEGLTYGKALREAKLELLRQSEYTHPYYWAGIILQGGN